MALAASSTETDDDEKTLLAKKKYNGGNMHICGGVKLVDGMNKQKELNFQCKQNDKRFKSKCRGESKTDHELSQKPSQSNAATI